MNQELSTRLSRVRSGVDQISRRLEYEDQTIRRSTDRISLLEEEKKELVKMVGVIDKAIQVVSANGVGKIESIVTDGLQRVFDSKDISLILDKKETARGNTYRIRIKKGETIGNPMDAFGGGIQNVVAFLLRVILIKRFKLAPFLALDEQFSNVSPHYQPRVAQLLKTLADLGFTIFAVSHQPLITQYADRVYQLNVIDGLPKLLLVSNSEDVNETGENS